MKKIYGIPGKHNFMRGFASALVFFTMCLVLSVLFVPQLVAQENTAPHGNLFLAPTRYSSVSFTDAVAVGDFNHDGKNDAALLGSSQLQVYLQQPDGTLAAPADYTAPYGNTMVAGDFNHDGRDDLAMAGGDVAVFLQKADGTLDAPAHYVTGMGPDALAVGDVNDDGWSDLFVAHWNEGVVYVFVQQADGTLLRDKECNVPAAGYDDIDVGDMNHDGRLDIVKMSGQGYANPNLSVCLQTDAGTFNPPDSYDVGNENAHGVGVGDLNGDGLEDAVISYGGNGNGTLTLFRQLATGVLTQGVSYPVMDIPSPIEIQDVNGDLRQDVLVQHAGWGNVSVLLQQANGTLGAAETYPSTYGNWRPQSFDVGDLNADGYPDLAFADNGLVVVYHYDPAHPPTPTPTNTPLPTHVPTATRAPTAVPPPPTILMQEGFEGAFPSPGWSTTGHWGKSDCGKVNGSYGAWVEAKSGLPCGSNYEVSEYSWMIYGPFDLTKSQQAALDFAMWLNAESGYDYLFVGASLDNEHFYGTSYTGTSYASDLMAQPQSALQKSASKITRAGATKQGWSRADAQESPNAGWRSMKFNLNSVYQLGNLNGKPQVWIGFLWASDSEVTEPNGAFLDTIKLTAWLPEMKPGKAPLRLPANGDTVPGPRVLLDWDPAPRGRVYEVAVREGAANGTEVQTKRGMTATRFKTKALTPGTTYYWQVNSCNSGGCTLSKIRHFTVAQ